MTSITQTEAAAPARALPLRTESWLVFCVGLALLGTAWVFDPMADAAFDAPKRLVAMFAAAAATAGLVFTLSAPRTGAWSRNATVIALLASMSCVGIVIATALSSAPNSWATTRAIAVFGLYLLIGAAPVFSAARVKVMRIAALVVALNALISLLQFCGVAFPIPIAQLGGRFATGALLGNEGYVALACALTAAAILPILLQAGFSKKRIPVLALFLLCVTVIAINRQLTSALALAVAAIVVVAVRLRMQSAVWWGAGLLLCLLISALVPTLREATWERLPLDAQAYQERSTYRLGAWAAALEMVHASPITGHGPGSYALRSQEFRQQAELKMRVRLAPPPTANAFVIAHQEYLQLAAEAGIATCLLAVGALVLLIGGLLSLTRNSDHLEASILLGVISAGAIAALAWFPMQIPLTAVLLLLACGRAWRLIADAQEHR